MKPVPPFRGMRKLADSYLESTGNSRTFDILKPVAVSVRAATRFNMRDLKNGQAYSRFLSSLEVNRSPRFS